MSGTYLLAIDQGTTGSTVLIVDVTAAQSSEIIGRHTVDLTQHYPRAGWVEHDLEEVWQSVLKATKTALERAQIQKPGFSAKQIAAIGITNQRETLCAFERRSGKPEIRAIVWQCKRSAEICSRLKTEGFEKLFREKTGLLLDPYFSGTKATWIMENHPALAARLRSGEAVLGTIDSYLMARLSGGEAFVTEASNASRTLLYDIERGVWDQDLLEILKVPGVQVLPEVRDSAGVFAKTKGLGVLPDGIPITGVLGDQQAAMAGQTCFDVGEAKCTYGTGAFLLLNLGASKLSSRSNMLTTVLWNLKGKPTYAFEGSAFIAGAAVQFLRDQMHMITSVQATEEMAREHLAAPEVYFVPALAGLGAPYWEPKANGAFLGLTRGTDKGQMVRAVLEGIAFVVCDLIDCMKKDFEGSISSLRVDGGASANNLLMESQADFAEIDVDRPLNLETTAFGAALFAGLGVGLFQEFDDMRNIRRTERIFKPSTAPESRLLITKQREGWKRAVEAVRVFAGTV